MGDKVNVSAMSNNDKVAAVMRRSLPLLPANARGAVEAMLSPGSIALIAGTLVVWAGSHFFGVGEVVDVILLAVGVVALGFSVFEGASELYDFATGAVNARTEADLNVAAQHFARAVVVLGISTIQAILLRGQGRAIAARGRPQILGRINVGEPPSPGGGLRLTRPASIAGGSLGDADAYGVIRIARNQSISEQRITLMHELVHRYFSPRFGPFRRLRAELKMSGYARSALLRYLEEAMAEGYAQLRVNGLADAIQALRFPLDGGYVTVSQLVAEGQALGTIVLGSATFNVSISVGPMPPDAP
jgi:hypothetical protein